ncbi:hypothetical protein QAD02_006032 [Eretmocerus hayati]|uniref:Uncharacterized protein n=1 Tax=Eretmocerus hayati TaxID=131215 RepID=A0ACC2MZX2_9HYME|nr:hypothetical protein QAD02_006032 [Eretmocerus hayati]
MFLSMLNIFFIILLQTLTLVIAVMSSKCTMIDNLNQDCLLEIFKNLTDSDKLKAELVCKKWRTVLRDVWKKCKRLDSNNGGKFKFNGSKGHVNLVMCKKILLRSLRNLTELHLTKVQNPQNWTIMDWEDKDHMCTHSGIDISSIDDCLLGCYHIETLRLCCCIVEFSTYILSKIIERNSNLRVLELADYCLSEDSLYHLEYESLESLFLLSGSIQDMNFQEMESECTKLKIYSLHKNEIEGSTKNILLMPPSLEQLDLSSDRNIGKFELNRMMKKMKTNSLQNLQILSVATNSNVNDGILSVIAQHCPTLLGLDISMCHNISNKGIRSLVSLPKLICLIADYCLGVTGEAFLNFNKKLRILSLRRYQLTLSQFFNILQNLENLEELTVAEKCISNAYVTSAVSITKQRTKNVPLKARFYGCNIQPEKIVNDCPRFTYEVQDFGNGNNFYEFFYGSRSIPPT